MLTYQLLNKFPDLKRRFEEAEDAERAVQCTIRDVIDHNQKYKAAKKAKKVKDWSMGCHNEREDSEGDEIYGESD